MSIEIDSLTFSFEENSKIFNNVSYSFEKNKIHIILGPNGCGKTTLLNIFAGLLVPENGTYCFNQNEEIKKSYVFQNYKETLLPWLTVGKNLLIIEKDKERVNELLTAFGIFEFKDRYPYELSGGQQQMLSLAKAFAYSADLMLLDEPFSGLDYNRSRYFWMLFTDLWEKENTTTFLISHSIEEAIFLGEHIHIMSSSPDKKFIKKFDLPFPKPNGLKWFTTKEYFEIRSELEKTIETLQ